MGKEVELGLGPFHGLGWMGRVIPSMSERRVRGNFRVAWGKAAAKFYEKKAKLEARGPRTV